MAAQSLILETRSVPAEPDSCADLRLELRLEENAVALWIASLPAMGNLEPWTKHLDAEERERASRFRFDVDRRRNLCGRGVLRVLAGKYLGADPAGLRFRTSEAGKPELVATNPAGLRFNVSHSGDYILVGFVWGRAIGVDVELIRPDIEPEKMAKRFFSAKEQQDLASLSLADRIPAFFRCWTRKEAYVKATGEGLGLPLSQFDVSFLPGEPAALLEARPDPLEASRWWMQDVDLGPDHAAAVIVATS